MSLSKPFRLQKLPRLALEDVFRQFYPIDLFQLAQCSEKMKEKVKNTKLALYCDVKIHRKDSAVEVSIRMRNGGTFKWNFKRGEYEENRWPPAEKTDVIVLDGLMSSENYQCNAADTIFTYFEAELFDVKVYGFCDKLLSMFPCPIRTNSVGCIGLEENVNSVFYWESVKKCERFEYSYPKEWLFSKVIEQLEVTKRITLDYNTPDNCGWWILRKIPPPRELAVVGSNKSLDIETFFGDREHLVVKDSLMTMIFTEMFCNYWREGKLRNLKTLKMATPLHYYMVFNELGPMLPLPEGGDTFIVKYSATLYIDATPQVFGHYRTGLIQNCYGEFGTIVVTDTTMYFCVWSLPLSPIEVPRGHRLIKSAYYPFHLVRPAVPEVFEDDESAQFDSEGRNPHSLIDIGVLR